MRIIAGKNRSRILKTLEGLSTRPMMDKMKESVFNTIGPYFDGGIVLDLFGGSGALSLEALSRGAEKSYIVELGNDAIKVIKDNVTSLKEDDNVVLLHMDYKVALKRLVDMKFDLVFLDPPYKLNVTNEIISYLIDHKMLNDECFVISHYVTGNATINQDLKLIKNYSTGINEVAIYKYEEENEK